MKRNFTNENFEDFLRQSADGLRMRPSDKVWKTISDHLNKRRRRVGFAIGTVLLALSTFTYFYTQSSTSNLNSFAQPGADNHSKLRATTGVEKPGSRNSGGLAETGKRPTSSYFSGKRSVLRHSNVLAQAGIADNVAAMVAVPDETNSSEFPYTIVDSYFAGQAEEGTKTGSFTNQTPAALPLTIESVINSYKPRHRKELDFQFYFTPTISYRKLSENKSFLHTQAPGNPNNLSALISDVNSVVTHKPNIGFELGIAARYPITKKMKLKGGIQLNVNRYDIKAYNAVATYTTLRFNSRSSNGADSMNTFTRYSNVPTYKVDWLENYYLQISTPVGMEFKISGNDKVQFGVGTTIQPTYVLGDRAYLISTDYKRYAEVPQLVRRWNVNTALETFVGYSTGRLSWQVGPQVRYQLLSSFVTQYPVKENLFDFGLKVGISVNK